MAYTIKSLWRYPVKSMAGEELATTQVTTRGLAGDRVYALVDRSANKVATLRTWAADLLNYRAQLIAEPTSDAPAPAARITTPPGDVLTTVQADIDTRLSAAFGRDLALLAHAPAGMLLEVPAGTLAGAYASVTQFPLGSAAPGTFFDYGAVHVIASSTVARLQSAYPDGRLDSRRFRPNIIIENADGEPFLENAWAGRTLALGEEVVLRATIPCPRCVVTTLPQSDLPRDPGILRTIVKLNTCDHGDFGKLPCAGVYADVVRAGTLRRGDVVRVTD